jgi:cyclase
MKIRVIPTILVNGATVVKGEHFHNWRTVGHVNSIARLLAARDVDEIIFLDTKATAEGRSISMDFVRDFAEAVNIPFGVGGGIRSLDQAKQYIRNGCEKVVLGDVLFDNPGLVQEIADELGSQAIVASIDVGNSLRIYRNSGQVETKDKLVATLNSLEQLGIGELLIQSIERDGTMEGYDIDLISLCLQNVSVPVLASGGAGRLEDFLDVAKLGVSGVCAGAMFQFTEFTPNDVRRYLGSRGIDVRN